ncbi:hypothetical protein NMG60_11017246 [Bertholletia excelsa]
MGHRSTAETTPHWLDRVLPAQPPRQLRLTKGTSTHATLVGALYTIKLRASNAILDQSIKHNHLLS